MKQRKEHIKMALERVVITNYLDYRVFLERLYHHLKDLNDRYSYLLFAEDLGFSQTNVLRLVVAGKRALSRKSALTVASHLDLKLAQRRYFLLLVEYNSSRSALKKDQLFVRLLDLKQNTLPSELDRDRLEYFTEWYHNVIREMIRLNAFVASPAWIAAHIVPSISAEQAASSLELLERIQQIGRDVETNTIKILDEAPLVLPADKTANHLSVINYHRHMLRLAQESISRFDPDDRELNALTLSLSHDGVSKLRDMIRKFCQDVLKVESQMQVREQVSQLNIQLFPLSLVEPTKVTNVKRVSSAKGAKS